jgi:hypothetical protein
MTHFFVLMLFSAIVAVVFGVVGREGPREQWHYGLKVFAQFVGFGLALAWVLYFFPL